MRALAAYNCVGGHVRVEDMRGQPCAPVNECLRNVAAGFGGGTEITGALRPLHLQGVRDDEPQGVSFRAGQSICKVPLIGRAY